jgi:hypothetical protein
MSKIGFIAASTTLLASSTLAMARPKTYVEVPYSDSYYSAPYGAPYYGYYNYYYYDRNYWNGEAPYRYRQWYPY